MEDRVFQTKVDAFREKLERNLYVNKHVCPLVSPLFTNTGGCHARAILPNHVCPLSQQGFHNRTILSM